MAQEARSSMGFIKATVEVQTITMPQLAGWVHLMPTWVELLAIPPLDPTEQALAAALYLQYSDRLTTKLKICDPPPAIPEMRSN